MVMMKYFPLQKIHHRMQFNAISWTLFVVGGSCHSNGVQSTDSTALAERAVINILDKYLSIH